MTVDMEADREVAMAVEVDVVATVEEEVVDLDAGEMVVASVVDAAVARDGDDTRHAALFAIFAA